MFDLSFLDELRADLDRRFAAREVAITRGRRVVRSSANAIRALHRGEFQKAEKALVDADAAWQEIRVAMDGEPALFHAGFVADSCKELAEAHITSALFAGLDIPGPGELAVDPVPWLHGLGEAVGELRRRLLDQLRGGYLSEAEEIMASMDAIVDHLAELDYPDGMTHGLRRVADVARSITERSRADLTATVTQERLRRQLDGR